MHIRPSGITRARRQRRAYLAPSSFAAIVLALTVPAAWSAVQAQDAVPAVTVRQVAGYDSVFFVRSDGSAVYFRRDALGPGAVVKKLELPGKVRQVAEGSDMAYALMEDGALYAWGTNDRGQFGRGPGSSRTPENPLRSERPIRMIVPADIVQISAAGHHAMAVRKDGTVLEWGDRPSPGAGDTDGALAPVPGLVDIVKVAAAGDHDLALTRGGLVFAWGENKNGQIGHPLEIKRSATPVQVPGLDHAVDIAAAGTTNFGFSGALKDDGTVWMWGSDESATMGDGVFWANNGPANENHSTPVMVKGVTGGRTLSAGVGHVMVLLKDGTIVGWGHDGWGQIGVGTNGFYQPLPKKPAITDVVAVYPVANSTIAVKADGTIWWWGTRLLHNGTGATGQDQKLPRQLRLPEPG